MKSIYVFSALFYLFSLCCIDNAYAGGSVGVFRLIWKGISQEQVIILKTIDLPNTNEFKYSENVYMDIGVKFNSRNMFWLIPVWNSEIEYIGYIDSDNNYLELSKNQLEQVANIKLPNNPVLPYWYSYGGKILLLIFVGLILHLLILSKSKS